MASTKLSRRLELLVGHPPLSKMSDHQRRDFQESLLNAASFEDQPGKWQATILEAERNRPKLRAGSNAKPSSSGLSYRSPTASRASLGSR